MSLLLVRSRLRRRQYESILVYTGPRLLRIPHPTRIYRRCEENEPWYDISYVDCARNDDSSLRSATKIPHEGFQCPGQSHGMSLSSNAPGSMCTKTSFRNTRSRRGDVEVMVYLMISRSTPAPVTSPSRIACCWESRVRMHEIRHVPDNHWHEVSEAYLWVDVPLEDGWLDTVRTIAI